MIEVANPTLLSPRNSVILAGIPEFGLGDTMALDSFQRLRVSESRSVFDAQQEYGLDTLRLWDITANGTLPASLSSDGSVTSGSNAVGPRSLLTRLTPITASTTNGHYAILQSKQYPRYIPGKSHLVLITGVFASGSNATARIVRRTSTSGSAVEEEKLQSEWNIDKFDGTGPSGLTLDLTKTQILFIGAQWLGVGRVIVGFDIGGRLYPAHAFRHANILDMPYTQTFNLPVRMEIRNTGAATSKARTGYFDSANGIYLETERAVAGGTINFCCASVQSEGGDDPRGFPNCTPGGTATIGVTTRRPVLSIRPKATYNSVTNRAHIEAVVAKIRARTNDALVEIVIGGTLTGAAFATVGANSSAEYDTSATAISGGDVVAKDYVAAGAGAVAGAINLPGDTRNPLVLSQIDALAATQTPLSIVCTSMTGTSDVNSVLNWYEQTT